ncbi:hypothetical protein [Limosilactobacillus allomucosae]|uniref:hypothetical protein n=1 Tax=Limosilactobacillus allomucosae TaxID=3142938 RepID=UPI0032657E6E
MKKIKISETAVFIIGSLGIALLGADFPPPLGFWKIIVVISLVALIQWYYLDWLLERINSKKSLLMTVGIYALLGGMSTATMIAASGQLKKETVIWLGLIILGTAAYGLLFWLVNWLIRHFVK